MGLKSNDLHYNKKRGHRKECHIKTEAEIKMI